MDILIFSKNRAMQLNLLLTSIDRFVPSYLRDGISIVYNASDLKCLEAYKQVEHSKDGLMIPDDLGFKNACLMALSYLKHEHVLVLCDDDVFVRPLTDYEMVESCYTFSLRLNPNMPYSLNSQTKQSVPNSTLWEWERFECDYSYPWSVSCSIWRRDDIEKAMRKLNFHNPNTLEDQLIKNNLGYPHMQCFDTNPMLNIPANRVQNSHPNLTIGKSAEELNTMFLNGSKIDLLPLVDIESNSPFLDYQYTFI